LIMYNSLINVLASSGVDLDLRQAESLLLFLEEHDQLNPDSYTYNGLLNAYAKVQCKVADSGLLNPGP
jgi:hypothetical protein